MILTERWPRQRSGERDPIPPATRAAVYARDGSRCVWCGSGDALTLDHITPWSARGSDCSENLRTLCWPCNERRSNYRTLGAPKERPVPATLWCLSCWPVHDGPLVLAFCAFCGVNDYTGHPL